MINRKSLFWLLVIVIGFALAFTYVYRIKYCARPNEQKGHIESQEEILARRLEGVAGQ